MLLLSDYGAVNVRNSSSASASESASESVTGTQVQHPCGEPAMPSVGTMISQAYFGPAPSKIDTSLIGPVQLLKSGTLDLMACTITLPLYKGYMAANAPSQPGAIVWFILTDTNDLGTANLLGLNYAAKLNFANYGGATRPATLGPNDTMTFARGTVDFSPKLVVPGPAPNFFPPTTATPGSVGDQFYSPIVTVTNQPGLILNAPSSR